MKPHRAVRLGTLLIVALLALAAPAGAQEEAALEELQGILVVWLAMLAAAYCLAEGLHLAVEVVARRLPAWSQPVVARLPGAACALFGLLLAAFGAQLVAAVDNTLPGTGWSASLHYQPALVAGLLIAGVGWRQALTGAGGRSGSRQSEDP